MMGFQLIPSQFSTTGVLDLQRTLSYDTTGTPNQLRVNVLDSSQSGFGPFLTTPITPHQVAIIAPKNSIIYGTLLDSC